MRKEETFDKQSNLEGLRSTSTTLHDFLLYCVSMHYNSAEVVFLQIVIEYKNFIQT